MGTIANNCSQIGGDQFTVTGTFAEKEDLEVFVGENGDVTDEPAYSGQQGFGYLPQSSDGLEVAFVIPPLDFLGSFHVTVRRVSDMSTQTFMNQGKIVERNWPSKTFGSRKSFPPWSAAGKRRLELEALP